MNMQEEPEVIRAIREFVENPKSVEDMYRGDPDAELGAVYLFSGKLERWLVRADEQIRRWSSAAWEIIQEEMPDACAEIEPCDAIEPFADAIRDIYERAMRAKAEEDKKGAEARKP